MEGALRRPWWVGGPFRTWDSFFVLWEMNLFFFLPKFTGLPLVPGSTTVPTAALSLSFITVRTAACRVIILYE